MSSSSVKPLRIHYLNNEEIGESLFSDDDDDDSDFNFKYVPTNQFKYIIQDVKRQRSKQDDERIWANFVKQQQKQENSEHYHPNHLYRVIDPKELMRNNLKEIDQDLKRLGDDALPEETEGLYDYKTPRSDHEKQKKNMVQRNSPPSPPDADSLLDNNDIENKLLTIPEEDRVLSTFEQSPISQVNVTTKRIKSRYEHTMKNHSDQSLSCNLMYRECSSNPEFTSNGSDNCQESYELRPHPIIAQKIIGIQMKISELLDEIFYRLCHIPPPDDDIDLKRRQQRVVEFAIRFSRNYLYELGRQMTNLQRHVDAISPNALTKLNKRVALLHMQALEQKLCSAHQLLLNALIAYCKHIPSSILRGHPGKLKEVLQIVVDVSNICMKINLTTENFGAGDSAPLSLGKDTQRRCDAILSKLHINFDNESVLFSHSAQSTLVGFSVPGDIRRRSSQMGSRKSLPNRFSMYTVDSKYNKIQRNRRPVGLYLKEKRPVIERLTLPKPPTIKLNSKNSSFTSMKSGKKSVKRSRMTNRVYQKEDDIKTMMDFMPIDSDATSSGLLMRKCHSSVSNGSKIRRNHNNKKRRHEKNMCPAVKSTKNSSCNINSDNKCSKDTPITDENLSKLLPILEDIITLIANKQNDCKKKPETISVKAFLEGLHEYLIQKNNENQNQPIFTSSEKCQEKLASKLNEPSEALYVNKIDNSKQEECNAPNSKRSEISEAPIESKPTDSSIKEKKNCKSMPSKVTEESIDKFFNHHDKLPDCQHIEKSSQQDINDNPNKSQEMMSWIADKVLDELAAEISKEMQLDDVVQKIFDLEFQEF